MNSLMNSEGIQKHLYNSREFKKVYNIVEKNSRKFK